MDKIFSNAEGDNRITILPAPLPDLLTWVCWVKERRKEEEEETKVGNYSSPTNGKKH
jgi:hypothetical protein